jgi:hypothetical protein
LLPLPLIARMTHRPRSLLLRSKLVIGGCHLAALWRFPQLLQL